MAQRYFDSTNVTCKNCGQSDNVNCPHGHRGAEVITNKHSDHEIFIMKIYIHVIFTNFTKILNHENLELYSTVAYFEFVIG